MGKAVSKVASSPLNFISGGAIGDTLFGKQDPGVAASTVDLTPGKAELDKLIGEYGGQIGSNKAGAAAELQDQQDRARAAVQDQKMAIQDQIAARGLGGSAAGLTALTSTDRNLGDQLNKIQAQAPNLELQRLGQISAGLGSAVGARQSGIIYNQAQASQGRLPGGIAPSLLAAGKLAAGA